MSYTSLYGRNPNTKDTTFTYPQPYLPMRLAPPLYFSKPAAATPIFGVTRVPVINSDETRVQLDPSSTYSYTKRWKGLGGLGEDPPVDNSGVAPKGQGFLKDHPAVGQETKTFVDKMFENPILTGIFAVVVGAAVIQTLRVFGGITKG